MIILLIEDEQILRVTLQDELTEAGYEVHAFEDPVKAMEFFSRSPVPMVITDIRLPNMNGMEVLERVKNIQPETSVILMTAFGEVSNAVEAMKKGAFDYLTKPFDIGELDILLKRAGEITRLRQENKRLLQTVSESTFVGESESAFMLRNAISTAAKSDITVLLTGETGAGKDLLAKLIHNASDRSAHPLVKISCAQYSRTVLESELFGHEQGAFTGANRKKKGKFALADQGTVYLDDVDDLSQEVQVKLLRVLDEKVVEPVGSVHQVPVNIRIIVSTKKDLRKLIQEGRFRSDLFYRLNAYPVSIPPLRKRKQDIPLLARYFLDRMNQPRKAFDGEALKIFKGYDWPGNVRELKNMIGRLVLSCPLDIVSAEHLPAELNGRLEMDDESSPKTFDEIVSSTEKKLLVDALQSTNGNQSQAARSLGMKLSTFRDRVAKHGIVTDRSS